ncbi:MAG TPA: heparinase II/III family protein [Stellaceae bacterium]|nr:heparinase II/III family protein [Stellaceae bacterium]
MHRARGDPGWWARRRRKVLARLAASPLYRYTLIGQVPGGPRFKIASPWPGDPKHGAAIVAGDIELAGELVRNPSPRWFPSAAGADWLAAWHGFGWLPDVVAVGPSGRHAAGELTRSWLAARIPWHTIAWRSDVLATRLFTMIACFDDIAGRDHDPGFRRAMLVSLAAQLRHLARTAVWERDGAARLRALKGLVAGTAVLDGRAGRLAKVLRALARELPAQLFADGGHRSRNPSTQLEVLRDLVDVRAVLRAAAVDPPGALQDAIERMAPILRLFRHGDRRLALFNGAVEEDGVMIDLALTRSEARGRAPTHAPDSGFNRLQAGKTLVLVDTGRSPSPGFDEEVHAGALSFEMSHERDRIIVNCGAYRGPRANWWRVARASAAHSVLVVADTNSVEIRDDGEFVRTPISVDCEHAEHDGQQWVSASHDGYRDRFGLTYRRELFLSADGEDLRGEDRLTGRPGATFAVRFHLHPSVEASLAAEEAAAVLRLPGGTLWRLRAAGAEIGLGESVYLGSGEMRRTQQVVLSGAVAPGGTDIRWALRREPAAAG